MGIEEQDQIRGRLTREERETRRAVGAIEAKVEDYSRVLKETSEKIIGAFNPPHDPVFSIDDVLPSIALIPDKSLIEEALKDLRASRERLAVIKRQLSAMD